MNKEIERKYTIKYLPDDIFIEKIENIEQVYIYHDKNTLIRIRKMESKMKDKKQSLNYIYTVKTKGDIQYKNSCNVAQKYEIESNITKEYYEELLPRRISNKITKTRLVVPIQNNLKVEIDIYYDYLEGFLTAEVEFPNEEDANKFNKPDWLGEELGYKELSNRKLAEMSKEEVRSKVSEECMNKNKIIINKLNKLIKNCY